MAGRDDAPGPADARRAAAAGADTAGTDPGRPRGTASEERAVEATFVAAAGLAAGDEPVAGGRGLRAGAVPLVLTGAVWRPDPGRLGEVAAFAATEGLVPAVIARPGDAVERALADAGWSPVTGVALDALEAPDTTGPEGAPVGWDGAAEVAAVLAAAYAGNAVEATEDDAHEEVVAALAALLASATAEDERVRLELGGDADGERAAIVVHEDDDAAVVVLAGGPSDRMVRSALATARGLGKAAWRLREVTADADAALLRRWEPTP